MLAYICAVLAVILCVFGIVAIVSGYPNVFLVLFLFALFFGGYAFLAFKKKKCKPISSAGMSRRKICTVNGIALYGLPQGESKCTAILYSDRVEFYVGNSSSVLYREKILSALLKTSSELKGATTGTVIAGTVLFGILGTIAASRPKSVKEYILAINYVSNGESKTVAIAVDKSEKYNAEKLVDYINRYMDKATETVL